MGQQAGVGVGMKLVPCEKVIHYEEYEVGHLINSHYLGKEAS
jgi:hypothetical protein